MNLFTDKTHQKIIKDIDHLYFEDQVDANTIVNMPDNKEELSSLNHRFSFITLFPQYSLSYISDNFQHIFGYNCSDFSIKSILNLVHPNDLSMVASGYKNACEFILNNFSSLPIGANILSLKFRLKTKKGTYLKVCVTNKLHEKLNWNKKFKLYSVCKVLNENLANDYIASNEEVPLSVEPNLIFTTRELQILKLMAMGKNSLEIGCLLEISKHTVDTHRRKMLSKSKYSNTAELIANSVSHGLIAG